MPSKTSSPSSQAPVFDASYHERQWQRCYDSSRAFFDFLDARGVLTAGPGQRVVDLCTGSGANLYWLLQRHPHLDLTGVELHQDLVDFGNAAFAERKLASQARLMAADIYNLPAQDLKPANGVIALQTISWMPDEAGFIKACASLAPDWIALTGLMIEGAFTYRTLVNDHRHPEHGVTAYATFSLDYLRGLFADAGYRVDAVEPFEISIDLPRPTTPVPGTYTEKTEDGRRLQMSGALYMNWQFLLARRA